ncbi:DUF6600 domain-containing protein [Geobacter sp. DSM 9736]|uniref:DUF6600 domain-containing protein n=1 Tax=Geobacter sp. DSM 9736 TaxID=1277350 RepID=UPI000B5138E6|nr:DUF6600 domain-containing protein [Geobacter sp. DSM 9736]SNB48024.1 FecR family protein [Geobacter sp. DSM 9736]
MRVFPFLVLTIAFLLPAPASASELRGTARIMLVQGDVQIRMADDNDWVPAAVNTPLEEGDSVWSPDGSKVEIQLRNGTYVRLGSETLLDLVEAGDDLLQFHLTMGHAYVNSGSAPGIACQFELTESTVTIENHTLIRLDLPSEGHETIAVLKGTAYVEDSEGSTELHSGEMLSIGDEESKLLPLAPPDAWQKWNQKRDRQIKPRTRSARLPEELWLYENELGSSGEWIEVSDYGRVWRPTIIAGENWTPYRVGRWIWRGDDYVWISYESWGWAPYHYGRWVAISGRGWCWVPPARGDVYWAPAYVGWITTPQHVAWVPLAPGEIYYGRGYYGRSSVTITNVTNINHISVTGRFSYRNQRAAGGALTVVPREAFATGRMNYVRTRGDIVSTSSGATISRPEPPTNSRTVRMPAIKRIPPTKLPPPSVAATPAPEWKQRTRRPGGSDGIRTTSEGRGIPGPDKRREHRSIQMPGPQRSPIPPKHPSPTAGKGSGPRPVKTDRRASPAHREHQQQRPKETPQTKSGNASGTAKEHQGQPDRFRHGTRSGERFDGGRRGEQRRD